MRSAISASTRANCSLSNHDHYQVYLRLPLLGFKTVDPSDVSLKKRLIAVAEECSVTVSFDDAPAGFVQLLGYSKEEIGRAIKAFHFLLSGPSTSIDYCHPWYILETSASGSADLALRFDVRERGGRRVTLPNNPPLVAGDSTLGNENAMELARQFGQQIRNMAKYLRSIPEPMMMRLHFGVAFFKQFPSKQPIQKPADFQRFTARVAERGTGGFDPE
jgi:hypothetical protein